MYNGKINVLIYPCESNSNELHDALSYCFNVNVYGASSVQRHGKYIYANYECKLPYYNDSNFISAINDYIDENHIDLIFTTHDTVALYLAEHAHDLHARVVQSDIETVAICRSKINTHEQFSDCAFVPKRYFSADDVCLPVFVKPDKGEGSHGAFLAEHLSQIRDVDFSKFLVTEYLSGAEYTIDCFTDKNGNLLYISPRSRARILSGIAVAGQSVELTEEIRTIAECINNRLKFLGLWYFQLRADENGHLKLMEISVRCAGTMCMTRAKGVNLPLLTVYAALGYDTKIFDNRYPVEMDRSFIGRYDLHLAYSNVYIDFDDTITLRGKVNPFAMFFLYQCHNQGKKVYLLTKHIYDIRESMRKFAISEELFENIIEVRDCDQKSKYILNSDSIFIDNMFSERAEVHDALGIPVFDADAFEFLLDWRV